MRVLCYVSQNREFFLQINWYFSQLFFKGVSRTSVAYIVKSQGVFAILPNYVDDCLCQQTFYDAEAIVTGYVDGKGKNKGVTGALQCKMESGKVMFFHLRFPEPDGWANLLFNRHLASDQD